MESINSRMIKTALCVLLFVYGGIAQAYYFWTKEVRHKIERDRYKVFRIDLNSGQKELFLKNGYSDIIYDATQTWMVNGEGRFNQIIDIRSQKPLFYIEYSNQILFSPKRNKLFLFGTDGNPLNVIDPRRKLVIKTDTLPGRPNNELSAFFRRMRILCILHEVSKTHYHSIHSKINWFTIQPKQIKYIKKKSYQSTVIRVLSNLA